MTVLVTGAAGFIGFHLSKELIKNNIKVVGYDELNSYYDIELKKARLDYLKNIKNHPNNKFSFVKGSLEEKNKLEKLFDEFNPEIVVNLAAQAGVRYSIENPEVYIQSNLVGFGNVLELSKVFAVKHLIYASSSSVYGGNTNIPFSEKDSVDHPVSLYAATKKANELMAHTYSHLYNLPSTGLRFFTVYGPWGRPDMALFIFTKRILENKKIYVFNNGNMIRDFTYIDDISSSLVKLIHKPPIANPEFDKSCPDGGSSWAPYKIFNVGNSKPVQLMKYIHEIEKNLGLKAKIEYCGMQPGDVEMTASNNTRLDQWIGFKPNTSIEVGIGKFIEWYKLFYSKEILS